MNLLVVILGSLLLMAVTAFCVFGFLATFEPTEKALAFRIGYAVICLGCLLGAGVLLVNAVRK